MQATLEITNWSEGRLAVAGQINSPETFLDRLREICPRVNIEYWGKGGRFTFSFPENMRREVCRIVEALTI